MTKHQSDERYKELKRTDSDMSGTSLDRAPDATNHRNASGESIKIAHASNPDVWTSSDGHFAITDNGATIAKQRPKTSDTANVIISQQESKCYGFEQTAEAHESTHSKPSDSSPLARSPGTFDVPGRGKVTKLSDGTILDWPKPGREYHAGASIYKSEWTPGRPLSLDPNEAVGTVINWVNTFSAANPGALDHPTGNALRHVLCPALLMNQYKLGNVASAWVLDCANILFEGHSAFEAAWPSLSVGNFSDASKIIDWDDTNIDLVNAAAGVNLGLANPFSSAEDICGKSIDAAFKARDNGGRVPNANFYPW
jgi:hypothetical protein